MRLLHESDLHVIEGERLADIVQVLAHLVEIAVAEQPDAIVVTGDLSGREAPHQQTIAERLVLARHLSDLATVAPVIVLSGNHDATNDLRIFEMLRAAHPIYVVDRPQALTIAGGRFYCLPYPSKRIAVGSGVLDGSLVAQKQTVEGWLREMLTAWRLDAQGCRAAGIPTIGAMHLNIGGSVLSGGEILIGQEIELSPSDLTELGFDAGLLGHIHRGQEMAPGWRYAGSIYAKDFGEEHDEKTVSLVEVESGQPPVFRLIPTGARRLVTVSAEWCQVDGVWAWAWEDGLPTAHVVAGCEVRAKLRRPEEALATCPLDTVATLLRDLGAHRVQLDPSVIPQRRTRLEVLTVEDTAADGTVTTVSGAEAYARAATIAERLQLLWTARPEGAPTVEQQTAVLRKLAQLEMEPAAEQAA